MRLLTRGLLLVLLAGAASGVQAQAPRRAPGSNWAEAGGFYQPVTHDFGDWKGGYGRLVLNGVRNTWYVEAKGQEAFRDRGAYASLSNVHNLSDRVYSQLGIGAGTGDYVLPDLRVDAALSVKLGSARKVVATAGVTLVDAKLGYNDKAAFGSFTLYAAPQVVAEVGARFNTSNPGGVGSGRATGALTLGTSGKTLMTIRGGAGTEGYQLTGAATTQRRFKSQDASLQWRQWLGQRFGVVLGGDWYHNPFYTRAGVTAGVFRAW